jgi:hypothetical protein
MRSTFAVAEYVCVRVGGVVVSTGEKGDGGTARREDRNGTAVVLIFAGIFRVVKKAGFKDMFASCEMGIRSCVKDPVRDKKICDSRSTRVEALTIRFVPRKSDDLHASMGRQIL